MNEKFILNVFDKFEKSSAVLLHIKEGEAELTLKKEAAYQNAQAAVPFALQNAPMQPIAGANTNGYAAAGTGISGVLANTGAEAVGATVSVQGITADADSTGASPVGGAAAITSGTDANLVTVKSPIVGSFYRSPSPDAPAYVDKGSKVSKGQPLCILEAMKMQNEIAAPADGTVKAVNVSAGQSVKVRESLVILG